MQPGPVIIDLEGLEISEVEQQRLLNPYVGGIILFSRNIQNFEQLKGLVADIRRVRPELLICVDQEGGRVQRCRDGFTRLPPLQVFHELFERDQTQALALAADCGWLLASEVRSVGIDFSFAPVLDVDESFCSVIGDRSFSSRPESVSALGRAFIEGMHQAGMAVTGKHFPGHGSVIEDSHLELPIDERSMAELEAKDLLPFKQLLPQLDALMPAHIVYPALDPDHAVGFSQRWLKDYLRTGQNYNGVIFSDCLTMEGAATVGGYPARAKAALAAGCDVILVCNNASGAIEVLDFMQAQDYPQACSRFPQMRPTNEALTMEQLQQQPRWQATSERLSQLQVQDTCQVAIGE